MRMAQIERPRDAMFVWAPDTRSATFAQWTKEGPTDEKYSPDNKELTKEIGLGQ